MTVKELIKKLLDYNPNAQVYIGDNLYNEIELTYGSSDGVTKENCEDVGFHIAEENKEHLTVKHNIFPTIKQE